MKKIITHLLSLSLMVTFLTACGAAHVRTEKSSSDLHQYKNIYLGKVDIHSQEEAAKTNEELQLKMVEWEGFARTELKNYVEKSEYTLVDTLDNNDTTLTVDLDIDLVYGNRAARYFGGFGAGKGSVDSVLKVTDPKTQEVKFHAVAESDLSVGAFGGSMESVLKTNIQKLIEQYPRAAKQ